MLISRKNNYITRFEKNLILAANNMDSLAPDLTSKSSFNCYFENSFQVLQDQITIIGTKFDKLTSQWLLVQEHLSRDESEAHVIEFGEYKNEITTILVMEEFGHFFAGCNDGNVIQYKINTLGTKPKAVKKYGNIGIGNLHSSVSVANLAVFGGDESQLAIISADKKQILGDKINCAIKKIYSFSVCQVRQRNKDLQVLLAISGKNSEYLEGQTDLLNVTNCLDALELSSKYDESEVDNLPRSMVNIEKLDLVVSTNHSKFGKIYEEIYEEELMAEKSYELERTLSSMGNLQIDLDNANEEIKMLKSELKSAKSELSDARNQIRSVLIGLSNLRKIFEK